VPSILNSVRMVSQLGKCMICSTGSTMRNALFFPVYGVCAAMHGAKVLPRLR
jgi:hypothetical protein